MGFLWHSPSEGSLSYPFTITHTILRTDLMHEGPVPVLQSVPRTVCVSTSKYFSTRVPDYPSSRVSVTYLVCVVLCVCPTTRTEMYRKFLGLRCVLIRVPSYPTTRVVAVTYSVCVYLLYGGPTIRTHRIFLDLRYLTTRIPGRRNLDTQILRRTRTSLSAR